MDSSPLAKLSPELRNAIYHLALYERRPVAISPHYSVEPGLLRVCKQIRQEAELIFYDINAFSAMTQTNGEMDHITNWLQRLSPHKATLIKTFNLVLELSGRKCCARCFVPDLLQGETAMSVLQCIDELRQQFSSKQSVECVVRCVVNGSDDSMGLLEASGVDFGRSSRHICPTSNAFHRIRR